MAIINEEETSRINIIYHGIRHVQSRRTEFPGEIIQNKKNNQTKTKNL